MLNLSGGYLLVYFVAIVVFVELADSPHQQEYCSRDNPGSKRKNTDYWIIVRVMIENVDQTQNRCNSHRAGGYDINQEILHNKTFQNIWI